MQVNNEKVNKEGKMLKPKCLDKNNFRDICLNADGYFTPCCWFDAADAKIEDPRIAKFFDKSLNIENYDDPKDIIEGKYWQKFFKMLVSDPLNAPERCWRHCGSQLITDKKLSANKIIKY